MQTPVLSRALFALCFAAAACGSPRADTATCPSGSAAVSTASTSAAPPIPSTSRVVDSAALGAQCLLSGVRTPPHVTSNHWQDAGEADVGGTKFGWIMVEQVDADIPEADAAAFVQTVEGGFGNRAGNASTTLCDGVWNDARAHTLVTVVVRVHADGEQGTYLVYGGLANDPLEKVIGKRVEKASASEARQAALAMLTDKLGKKFKPLTAPGDWFELAR